MRLLPLLLWMALLQAAAAAPHDFWQLLSAPSASLGAPPPDEPTNRLLPSDLGQLSDCQRGCASDLAETWATLLRVTGNHVDRYNDVCREYSEAAACMAERSCDDPTGVFATLTSGIRYMCADQKEAFNATIACVDAQASNVQRECDQQCNSQAVMMKWMMDAMTRMSDGGALGAMGGGGGVGGMGGGGAAASGNFINNIISSFVGAPGMGVARDNAPLDYTDDDSAGTAEGRAAGEGRGLPLNQRAPRGPTADVFLHSIKDSMNAITNSSDAPESRSLSVGKVSSSGSSGTGGDTPLSRAAIGNPLAFDGLAGLPGVGGQGAPLMDMASMRSFTADACQVSECFLGCLRNKMNALCEGSAGSLLSEVFIRPLAKTQQAFNNLNLMGGIMGMLMPQQCRFLYDTNQMHEHQIDPSLDQDLKRMYLEKQAEREKEMGISGPPSIIPEVPSPFDSLSSLDDLIKKHYGGRATDGGEPLHLTKSSEEQRVGWTEVVFQKGLSGATKTEETEGSGDEGSGEEGSGAEGSGEGSGMEGGERGKGTPFSFDLQPESDGILRCQILRD